MKRILTIGITLGLAILLNACGESTDKSTPKPKAVIETSANSTFSLKAGQVIIKLDAGKSTSTQDTNLSYKWELIARPELSKAHLNSIDTVNAEFNADLPGNYVVSLIVNDGINSKASRMSFTATTPVPVAITQPVYSVNLGADSIGLDARHSSLPTGEVGQLEYKWVLKEKPAKSMGYLANQDQSQTTLYLDVVGDYKLQLVVSYNSIKSKPTDVVVTVSAGNAPPVAKAQDITIALGQKVVLDGSSSVDPEGQQLQYRWTWGSTPVKPKGVPIPELQGKTTSKLRFTPKAAAIYKLKFFVYDGTWKSKEKDVIVTVTKASNSTNMPPIGKIIATGYFPSHSIGEQEVGRRADFKFVGYDTEGDPLQITDAKLIGKPAGSAAKLVDNKYSLLGKKIKVLDLPGNYRVQMVISDGQNKITKEATIIAKIGNINNQPYTGVVRVQSKSVLVGDKLIFDASSSDKDLDRMLFHWELSDKPDGSQAIIEAVIEPESNELRRAQVITDIPGSYTARLIVEDDRGLFAKNYAEDDGIAKVTNSAPEISFVNWTLGWRHLRRNEHFYQILPCMALTHDATIIDADGDRVRVHNELISKPENGDFGPPSNGDCPNTGYDYVFTKPGTYIYRYNASDGIADAPSYDFTIKVDDFKDAKGVLLRGIDSENKTYLHALPYEIIPPFADHFHQKSRPFMHEGYSEYSLEAIDADYTIENVQVRHINGDLASLTPRFEGLSEGQIIKKGSTINFSTVLPAVPCIRNNDYAEGFHLSFRIKELPEITFTREVWRAALKGKSYWRQCTEGELN